MSPATKKPRYKRRVRLFILFLRLLPGAAVVFLLWALLAEPARRGLELRREIQALVDTALAVRVVEHSVSGKYRYPFTDQSPAELIYGTVELDSVQRERLKASLPMALDYNNGQKKCRFEPHHRLEAVQKNGSIREMEICFRCGDFAMDGTAKREIPKGWIKPLRGFVSSLGMKPDGPWDVRDNLK